MDKYTHKAGVLKLKSKKTVKPKPVVAKQKEKAREPASSSISRKFELQEGRIVSNETTVQGFETKFIDTISVGDTIGVNHPTSLEFEERSVMSLLSQRTLTIDGPFSSNLVSTTAYFVRKDSVQLKKDAERAAGSMADSEAIANKVQELLEGKTVATQKSTLQIREKTGMWTYKVRTERLNREATAEELLDMRVKQQGRDKYC